MRKDIYREYDYLYKMVTIIKKGSTLKSIRQKLLHLKSKQKKSFNAEKYLGILSAKLDPVSYQKRIRNEWE